MNQKEITGKTSGHLEPRGTSALLVVDVQNDFCAGGALAVEGAEQILQPLNGLLARFAAAGAPVYASRDWHPSRSAHFATGGGRWPVHCVAGSPGAAFHPALQLPAGARVVSKGQDGADDGYSAFEGTLPDGTKLAADLRALHVQQLYVAGLATDFCVGASARDALAEGFQVVLLADAMAGIQPEASKKILHSLETDGAQVESAASVVVS